MRVHPVVYFLLKFLSRAALVLIFIGIPVLLYFLRFEGIGFGAREALGQALSTPTLEVEVGKLALDPFSGLVASGVVVAEKINHGRVLARISRVSVSLNLSELLQRRIVVDSLRLNGADASIPSGPAVDAPRLTVTRIGAEILLLGDKLRVSRFECLAEGIRFEIAGEVLNPLQMVFPEPDEEGGGVDFGRVVDEVRKVMDKVVFAKGPPLVRMEFRIDATNPSGIEVPHLSVIVAQVAYGDAVLRDVEVLGDYDDGIAKIARWRMRDAEGGFQASGYWDTAAAYGEMSVLSGLNPFPLLAAAGVFKMPEGISFESAPELGAEVRLEMVDGRLSPRITGHFRASAIDGAGVRFLSPQLLFAWRNGVFHAREIGFSVGRGEFEGIFWAGPGDYRLNARTTIPPVEFLPLLKDRGAREFIGNMEFADLPEIEFSLRAKSPDFATFTGNGSIKLGRTATRGAWIDSGSTEFSIADRCIDYTNLVIRTGEGKGTGAFAYDIGRQEVRLQNIQSTLVPVDVLMWINPQIAQAIRPYRFRSNPDVRVNGKVHMKLPTGNDLAIRIESPAGMEYDLLEKTLVFGSTSARVDVKGNTVLANVTKASLMGGEVSVKADVSIDPAKPVFSADVSLTRVDFSKLTNLYFDYDDSKGVVTGRYRFKTRMGQENLMTGNGSLRIEDGNVFAIPWLGPFSTILGGILPGVFYNTARLATADFTVANEKITTPNIEIIGKGFTMYGNGDIYFLTGGLDMNMRINAQGIPGIVFFPVSKILEYHSDGTISDPRWMPRLIPRFPLGGRGAKTKENR